MSACDVKWEGGRWWCSFPKTEILDYDEMEEGGIRSRAMTISKRVGYARGLYRSKAVRGLKSIRECGF